MEHLDITHFVLLGVIIIFAIASLPKAAKELLVSAAWVVVGIYLAGKFGIIEGLIDVHMQ
jgi:hypothetical protein